VVISPQFIIGVDLGGTKILTALADMDGRLVAEVKVSTEAREGRQHVLGRITGSVEQVLEKAGVKPEQVQALALGAPGPLDTRQGIIHFAPNLGWHDLPVKQVLEQRLAIPVLLDNDANLAALGEHRYGAGRNEDNMVYITVSTGIGGGLILGGRLYHGSADVAGEIGHMTVCPDGPLCSCGNRGCLEALASGTAIAREARELAACGRGAGILAESGGDPAGITAVTVAAAAAAGDAGAKSIIARAARYLGIGIANIINILNPSLVVLGGGVMDMGELIWQNLRPEVQARTLEAAGKSARLAPAELGSRAGVMGAVALALQAGGVKN
jgi:glucokinase